MCSFPSGFIVSGKEEKEAVAVKVAEAEGTALEREYGFYEKLGVVDKTNVFTRKECILSVYHFRKNLKVGNIAVSVMFMQLAGSDLESFVLKKKVKFTLKEVLATGESLVIWYFDGLFSTMSYFEWASKIKK